MCKGKSMKKMQSVILVLCITLSLIGCGQKHEEQKGYTFTDDLGRKITVTNTERTATLLGSFADMWMLAGGTICASADDAWEDFQLPLKEDVVNLGSTHRPNKEELLASNPTFVLASSKLSKHLEMQETLESMGITVAYFDVGNFQDFLRVFRIMTDVLGTPEQYEIYGSQQEKTINTVLQKYKNEKEQIVLVMRASAANIRAKNSEDTILGGMLADFGCKNIADSDSMLLDDLSIESVLLQNPDKIFFVETGDDTDQVKHAVENLFKENPLWYQLDAVKNNKVYFMDKSLYNLKPNARFAEGYKNLGKLLYEE